jgi:hypothetical protein
LGTFGLIHEDFEVDVIGQARVCEECLKPSGHLVLEHVGEVRTRTRWPDEGKSFYMTKPVFIPVPGVFVPASIAAAIRHGLRRELEMARRSHEQVSPNVVATIELIDQVGAGFDNKWVLLSAEVSSVDSAGFDAVVWISMKDASTLLGVTPQAVGRLVKRGSPHGQPWSRLSTPENCSRGGRRSQPFVPSGIAIPLAMEK